MAPRCRRAAKVTIPDDTVHFASYCMTIAAPRAQAHEIWLVGRGTSGGDLRVRYEACCGEAWPLPLVPTVLRSCGEPSRTEHAHVPMRMPAPMFMYTLYVHVYNYVCMCIRIMFIYYVYIVDRGGGGSRERRGLGVLGTQQGFVHIQDHLRPGRRAAAHVNSTHV